MFRLVQELRPTWVIGENVGGHIKLGLDTVISDLESEDYAVRPFSISASSIGANHQRERIWIVAYSERNGLLAAEKQRSFEKTISNQSKGKNDTLNVERTSSVSETISDVAHSRRSQWPRAELRGENENETRQENANQFERSSSTSEFNVANTQSQWSGEIKNIDKEKRNKGGSETQSYSSGGMWPTPSQRDYKGGSGTIKEKDGKYYRQSDKTGTKYGVRLDALIEYQHRKMYPTPAAHEGRLGYQRRDTGKKGTQKSLTTIVIDDEGGREKTTGQLNPTWVEWLMGYPKGWTDLNH